MALKGNGTSQYAAWDTGIAFPATYSFAFWYKALRIPGVSTKNTPFSFRTSSGGSSPTTDATFTWSWTSASLYKQFEHRESTGAFRHCQLTSSPAANTWHHIACTYDGTNMKVWLNGTNEATTAATAAAVTSSQLYLLTFGNADGWDDGTIAEVAMWNVALTALEVAALATARVQAILVRPTALLAYLPCLNAAQELRQNGMTMQDTVAVANEHPPINYARNAHVFHQMANATINYIPTGGMTIAGTNPMQVAYTESPSGGIGMAGTSRVGYPFAMTNSIAFAGAGNDFRQDVAFAGALQSSQVYAAFTNTLNLRQKFRFHTNYLASGRYRR